MQALALIVFAAIAACPIAAQVPPPPGTLSIVPSAPLESEPIVLLRDLLPSNVCVNQLPAIVTRTGSSIDVQITYNTVCPPFFPPDLNFVGASLGGLPAGQYEVVLTLRDQLIPVPYTPERLGFVVLPRVGISGIPVNGPAALALLIGMIGLYGAIFLGRSRAG